jgi:hypothetical protein
VVIGSGGQRIAWGCERFEDLAGQHFARLAGMEAELVIFGSGSRIRFPQASWLQPLMASGASAWKPWTQQRPAAPTTSSPAKAATWWWPLLLEPAIADALGNDAISG